MNEQAPAQPQPQPKPFNLGLTLGVAALVLSLVPALVGLGIFNHAFDAVTNTSDGPQSTYQPTLDALTWAMAACVGGLSLGGISIWQLRRSGPRIAIPIVAVALSAGALVISAVTFSIFTGLELMFNGSQYVTVNP